MRSIIQVIHMSLLVFGLGITINAQTTEFTYQGKLTDNLGAGATYDMIFRLCATESGSCTTPIATFTKTNVVPSSQGIFAVNVDFGFGPFTGADRFIEIAVRRSTETTYTTLAPRKRITSAPYASQSLNATFFDNRPAEDFIQEGDPRLQTNYSVLNSVSQQAGVNFNIGGTGSASVLNAGTQFNLAGDRILSSSLASGNLFAGRNSGAANGGSDNSFFGTNTGRLSVGNNNSFFGAGAGEVNSSGNSNSMFGGGAGGSNTTGGSNSFFGAAAGVSNQVGSGNAFFGANSGVLTTAGNNTFLGRSAGAANVSGSLNTAVGSEANFGSNNLSNANAFGARAFVTQSNSVVLGSINGVNGSSVDTRVGIGTTAPANKLHILDASNTGVRVQNGAAGGTVASFGSNGNFRVDSAGTSGGRFSILEDGNVGIGDNAPTAKLSIFQNTSPNPALSVVQASALGTGLSVVLSGGEGTALSVAGSGTGSTALQVSNGAIRVPGAGIGSSTAVFVVERNVSNTCEDYLIIDNPYTNNDPNAILIVTAHLATFSPFTGGASIFYVTSTPTCPSGANKWWARPNVSGAQFKLNVMVIKP